MHTQTIDLYGCRIAFRVSQGSGTCLLFLHGAGSAGAVWQAQGDFFQTLAPVIIPDLPGHGDSPGRGRTSIDAYAGIVTELMAALGKGPFVVIGHSMGGAIAQTIALAHPEMIMGLVLMGTGARLRVTGQIFTAIEADYDQYLDLASSFSVPATAGQPIVSRLRELFSKTEKAVVSGDFRACDDFDIMDRVASIRTRTLIINGDSDMMTPLKYAQYLHEQIPGSRLHVMAGTGHMAMIERPEEVNAAIKEFLFTCFRTRCDTYYG